MIARLEANLGLLPGELPESVVRSRIRREKLSREDRERRRRESDEEEDFDRVEPKRRHRQRSENGRRPFKLTKTLKTVLEEMHEWSDDSEGEDKLEALHKIVAGRADDSGSLT